MDITALWTNYVQYVFGSVAYATLALMFIVVLIGVRMKWSLDTFIIVLTPLIALVSQSFLPFNIEPLWLFGVGLIVSFGLIALLRR